MFRQSHLRADCHFVLFFTCAVDLDQWCVSCLLPHFFCFSILMEEYVFHNYPSKYYIFIGMSKTLAM